MSDGATGGRGATWGDGPEATDADRGTLRVAVAGATGRMGRTVLDAAADRPGVRPVAGLAPDPPERSGVADVPVVPASDPGRALAAHDPDVVVDFSAPAGTVALADACAAAGVALVSGTTGLDDDHRRRLRRAGADVPVLWASNFSRGALALRRAVADAVRRLPAYDVEVVETHHSGKRDAPSGTALDLVEAVESVRGESGRVHGREGEAPRGEEVGVHAVRAGDVTGEHAVLVAGDGERLRLTHRVGDRRTFAAGALDAAAAVVGRPPGHYRFEDVVGTGNGTGAADGAGAGARTGDDGTGDRDSGGEGGD